MSKINAKRQITLPIELCREAHINPGDECDCYLDNNGHIVIIKKISGSARGILKGRTTDKRLSDKASFQSVINTSILLS